MNIFYFGGTSFVSQYLIKDLSKKFNVVNFSRSNVKYCRSYYLNLSKKPNRSLIKKFNTIKPDYIFIFSSFVPLNEVNSSWEDCKRINIIGFINLIKAIQFKPKKIILASSCSLYGPDLGNKNVNSFLIPSSGYSLSKFAQENILRIFCNINNISFLSYRIGYAFGNHMNHKRLVKKILFHFRKNKKINLFNKKKNLNLIHTKDISRIVIGTFKKTKGIINLCAPYKTTLGLFYHFLKKEKKFELNHNFNNLKQYKNYKKIKIFSFKDAIDLFKNEN
jgi:nucleoside-diphosphate-sugar epimerase